MHFKPNKLPDDHCPACQHPLNAASQTNGEDILPEPDDVSVCINCGTALVFQQNLRLRIMTEEEMTALPPRLRDQLTSIAEALRNAKPTETLQ